MRVLNIIGEPVGGIRRHVHSIIYGLITSGVKCGYVYSGVTTDKKFRDDLENFEAHGVNSMSISMIKRPGFSDFSNFISLYFFCKKNEIELVHAHGAKSGVYARLLKIFLPIQVVYTPHGGVLHEAFGKLEGRFYVFVERLLKRWTDLIIFESEYSFRAYEKKIAPVGGIGLINYNGVCTEGDSLNSPSGFEFDRSAVNCGIFARLHPLKGQEYAIHAIRQLNMSVDSGVRYFLHLFGDGDDLLRLKKICLQHGDAFDVVFHGEVDNPEAIMRELDFVLIPSLFESFSYVAAEAMSVGTPVIASDVGGLKEVLGDGCGVLIPPCDSTAIAAAIIDLRDEKVKNEMVARARTRCAKRFDERFMVRTVLNSYARVLNP